MRPIRSRLAVLALLLAGLAPAAHAQVAAVQDSGLLLVYEGDRPVAHENYRLQAMGDSLLFTAVHERVFVDDQGARHAFKKNMLLVVDSRDLGLMRYVSIQEFKGGNYTRGLFTSDTSMTYYHELDGAGGADRVVQPPGRLFVMDSQLFTLFDVLCRSLANKSFDKRRVQMLALLPDSLTMPVATVTMARPDTVRIGGRRVTLRHYVLEDPSATFELWADPVGRLVRLVHAASGVHVERDLPTAAAVPVRRRTSPRR